MSDTLVVIPCFNEAGRLDVEQFTRFADSANGIGFVFVNDGSTDDTLGALARMCESRPQAFQVHSLAQNRGKAEAVRTGINTALAQGARYVGYWDADLSTPLAEILDFRNLLDNRPELACVFGSRVRRLGADVRRDAIRHYLGRIFATIASLTLGLPVYDTQCGAKLFRACDEIREVFAQPFLSRWIFDVEILARFRAACRKRGRITARGVHEFPLPKWQDVAGSKLKPHHMMTALIDVVRIHRRYR